MKLCKGLGASRSGVRFTLEVTAGRRTFRGNIHPEKTVLWRKPLIAATSEARIERSPFPITTGTGSHTQGLPWFSAASREIDTVNSIIQQYGRNISVVKVTT
jgi:hypothetical protein